MNSMDRPAAVDAAVLNRLSRLERINRLLGVAVLAGAAFALSGFLASAPDVPDLLQVRALQIVDAEGRVRMELAHDSSGTRLYVRDEAGDVRVGVAQFAHGGGGVALHGPGGRGAAVLYLKGDGSLTFYDAAGTATARFPAP